MPRTRSVNVKALRQRMGLSQVGFALRFRLPLGTCAQWETGRHRPDATGRVLLAVLDYAPDVVEAAIASAGLRHQKICGPKFAKAGLRGGAVNKAAADRFARNVAPIIAEIKASGAATSLRGIARALDARGIAGARGGRWTNGAVRGVLDRAGA